jgi:hypothetical protein
MAKHWLLGKWGHIKQSMTNPNSPHYHKAQAKNLTCEFGSFSEFREYIESELGHPEAGQNLARIDQNIGWVRGNLEWATHHEISDRCPSYTLIEFNGEVHTMAVWSKKLGANENTVLTRLQRGWEVIDAITIPAKYGNKYAKIKTST